MADSQLQTNGGSNKVTVQGYLRNDLVRQKIDEMLGKRANQFVTALIAATNNVANLSACTPASVLNAALTVAALDLPINNNLGFAYIIPYKNKGQYEAQFQMGWKGFIQLAQRSGSYKTIAATPVYEGQLVSADPLLGNTFDWNGRKSDKVVGYVAQFQLLNGFAKDLYMTMDEVKDHAARFSQAYRYGSGPWKDDFDAMAQKTVIKQLISKFGPMSIDPQMQMAVERDQAIIDEGGAPEYPDNTPQIADAIATCETTEELDAYLQTLSVDDRKKVTGLVNDRVKELSVKPEAPAPGLTDEDKREIEESERKAAEAEQKGKK